MLDTGRDILLHQYHPPRYRLLRVAVPLRRRAGGLKQLHQPVHLRRQVPRVPDGHQTHAGKTGSPGQQHYWSYLMLIGQQSYAAFTPEPCAAQCRVELRRSRRKVPQHSA